MQAQQLTGGQKGPWYVKITHRLWPSRAWCMLVRSSMTPAVEAPCPLEGSEYREVPPGKNGIDMTPRARGVQKEAGKVRRSLRRNHVGYKRAQPISADEWIELDDATRASEKRGGTDLNDSEGLRH